MKKYITIIVSILLVAVLSIGVWAVNKAPTTSNMDLVLEKIDGIGKDFLKSTAKPTEPAGTKFDAVLDGDDSTSWTAEKAKGSYIQKDFDSLTTVNAVTVKEVGNNIRKFHIEAWNGVEWVELYSNDLMQSFHQCILKQTVMTYSIRVTVDKVKDSSKNPVISTLEANYQSPIALDKEFVNMAYMTDCSYYHDWDPISPERMSTHTDICIISNWCFDGNGDFVIAHPIPGVGGFQEAVSPSSEKGKAFTKKTFDTVNGYMGEIKPKLWLCITCLAKGKTGANPGTFNKFNDDTIRAKFIKDVVDYCKANGVYGVDIDWEYPATDSAWAAYGKLVIDMATALHAEGMELSTAQSAYSCKLTTAQLNTFDRVNIMSYDMCGALDGQHSTFEHSAVNVLKTFMHDKGVEREKVILGIPWYADQLGNCQVQSDWKAMYQLLLMASEDGESIDEGVNSVTTWSFNGPNLIRDKIVYALQNRIGGIFCWSIKNDLVDFNEEYSITALTQRTLNEFCFVKEKN